MLKDSDRLPITIVTNSESPTVSVPSSSSDAASSARSVERGLDQLVPNLSPPFLPNSISRIKASFDLGEISL